MRKTIPMWNLLPSWEEVGERPNKSQTYVMEIAGKGIVLRVSDWSLGSLSVALTFIPGATLADFGIESV